MFLVKNMLEYMDNLGKQTMLAIRSQSFTKCQVNPSVEKDPSNRMLSGQVESSHHIIVQCHALSEVPCLHVQGSTLDVVQ